MMDCKNLEQRLQEIYSKKHIAGMAVAVTGREDTIFASGFGVE